VEDLYKIFKALGEKTRYRIILELLDTKNNICCTDLSTKLQKDLSTISRQLNILEESNLIVVTKINKTKCIKLRNQKLIKELLKSAKNIIKH
jgi:DNA-binding transcriptional ArsR family regulator